MNGTDIPSTSSRIPTEIDDTEEVENDDVDDMNGAAILCNTASSDEPINDVEQLFSMFVKNQITYDEFMRREQALQEKLGGRDGDTEENVEDVEDDEDAELMEEDDELEASTSSEEDPAANEGKYDRGKTEQLDRLIGQASVLFARGNPIKATELLKEVIKQDHLHVPAHQLIAMVYEQTGENQKALQFGLLASHLDPHTSADDWVHWGDQAKQAAMYKEAAVCFERALRLDGENRTIYEKRIAVLDHLGLRPLAMRTRLQAAQNINCRRFNVDFQWFRDLICQVVHYYTLVYDEEKAILGLEAFVLRSLEFGENAEAQHEFLGGLYLAKDQFRAAGKSILSLCRGVKPVIRGTGENACEITYTNGTYECVPFPPMGRVEYEIDDELFPISMHCHLAICLFSLNEIEQLIDLEEKLLQRKFEAKDEKCLLDVARAYETRGNPEFVVKFLKGLSESKFYDIETSADYWCIKGRIEMQQRRTLRNEKAKKCFENVLQIQRDHIDNRMHLSTFKQKAGRKTETEVKPLGICEDTHEDGETTSPKHRRL